MREWRADAVTHADHLPRTDDSSRPRPRRSAYHPPEAFQVLNFTDLLPESRPVAPAQQSRLGIAASGTVWCAGDISLIRERCVAIVGTRKATAEGANRARRLGRELAEAGVVVVSGLAKGIDTHALSGAIEGGGRVIAVIGTPIDKAYPAENKELQERIYRDHLLISQFRPGARVFPTNFPERNKLMAALSDVTVIIEAGENSGTLHQAAEVVRLQRWLLITRSQLANESVTWTAGFKSYAKMRELAETADVLGVLPAQP